MKVRYRGLAKNTAQLHTLFALADLWMARRRLVGAEARVRPKWPGRAAGRAAGALQPRGKHPFVPPLRDTVQIAGRWPVGRSVVQSVLGGCHRSADELGWTPAEAAARPGAPAAPRTNRITCLSTVMTREPGDILATGTRSGVGVAMKPPSFRPLGDVMRVEIDGIGHVENLVIAEPV